MEYVVMIAAVVAAALTMADYVRRSFNAQAKSLEITLNQATAENLP